MLGGHAFAIVAYDERGFWIQNSWGADWGLGGFCQVTYDDWLANGSDVWVATPRRAHRVARARLGRHGIGVASQGYAQLHVLRSAPAHHQPRQQRAASHRWHLWHVRRGRGRDLHAHRAGSRSGRQHLLLYAHGGLTPEDSAIQKVADLRGPLLDAGVYPLSLVWKTDFWTTLTNILQDAVARRRPEGFLDATKDFMLDRLDDALEPLARVDRRQGAVGRDEGERDARQRRRRLRVRARARSRSSRRRYPTLEDPHGRPQRRLDSARRPARGDDPEGQQAPRARRRPARCGRRPAPWICIGSSTCRRFAAGSSSASASSR